MTITVLENARNEEGLFLPRSYTVQTWDAASGELKASEAVLHRRLRVGSRDLPAERTVLAPTSAGSQVVPAPAAELDAGDEHAALDKRLAPFFHPPEKLAKDFGDYKSPLVFDDGSPVKAPADWAKRRKEILNKWHELTGPW